MGTLGVQLVQRNEALSLSPRDARAIAQIVSWEIQPTFAKPGRTAWYVLQDPIRSSNGGPLLLAAKLKGVGAWNPADSAIASGIKGVHPSGTLPPSLQEYEETAKTVHFGIDAQGAFKGVYSERAPFGSILLRRAQQEFDNAQALFSAHVPSIAPYALFQYDSGGFNGEPIGAVVSLAPDESPYSLDFLYQREREVSAERRQHFRGVLQTLAVGDELEQRCLLAAQREVSQRVGQVLRRFAQAGLYRHSSAWDNFYFNRRDAAVYVTDLDSSRRLQELPPDIGGMQVLRDLAGALWRLPKQYSEREAIADFQLGPVLDADPLAAILTGYFGIGEARARAVVDPLWQYFIPYWFLLKRQGAEVVTWPKDKRKSYRIDKNLFHCLAILAVAPLYRETQRQLRLPPLPCQPELVARMRAFLGEPMDYVEWLLRSARSGIAG